ncbi:MAG: phytoene desaturase [Alphaproteobacteria bacterium]|nr:phytoene desaturase [Alphaproteobacteria bacterium]
MSERPMVVVGSGFGGLAAAVRLRAMGHQVLVLEANEQHGGRGSVFRQDGFSFDAGPTVITAPYLLEELFSLLGRDIADYVELMPVDPFYRVMFPDGSRFDYVGDEERLISQIRELSPGDVDGYLKMADHAREIFDIGYAKLADQPFDRLSDMLRVVPSMIRLRSDRTVWQLACRYLKDHRLRQVFTFQPLLVGGSPLRTSSIYMLIHWLERKWGVWFPRGGTGALVQALVDLLEDVGVELRTNSPVEEIEVENGQATAVRLASGERIACSGVVFNGDPSHAYGKLVAAEHRKTHTDRRIARRTPSMSLFVTYFGTDKTYDDTVHHTILLGPRYEGLLKDLFVDKVLADDFSLYLHRPTASDPGLAPAGHDGFYVLSPVPNDRSGIDWSERAPEYEDRILTYLDQGHLPGVKKHIVTKKSVDPRYFAGRLRSVDGAAFGLEPTLLQSAYFRYHNQSEDVGGLWFVGASTHPGAGVPGVLCSAKVLEKVVQRPEVAIPVPAPAARAVKVVA